MAVALSGAVIVRKDLWLTLKNEIPRYGGNQVLSFAFGLNNRLPKNERKEHASVGQNRSSSDLSSYRNGWPRHGDANWIVVSARNRQHKSCPASTLGMRAARVLSRRPTPFFRFRSWTVSWTLGMRPSRVLSGRPAACFRFRSWVSQELALAPTFRLVVTTAYAMERDG